MNWADWSIVVIVAISSLMSLQRGFIREALSLVTWVVAFVIARVFSGSLSVYLTDVIDSPAMRLIAAFAGLFIVTLIVGAVVGALIKALVTATGLTTTDRVLGMGFGAVRGGLVVVVIIIVLKLIPEIQNEVWWKQSVLIPHFLVFEDWTRNMASDLVAMIWNAGS